jgi:hypothetical protein
MARPRARLLLGLVPAVVIVLYVGLAARCPRPVGASVKDSVVTFLRTRLPGLRIGRIEAGLGRLTLHRVTVGDRFGNQAIRVARAELSYRLLELLSHRMHIERLVLVEPRVVVKKAKSGRINLAELLAPSAPSKPKKNQESKAWVVRVDALAVRRGEIRLHTASGRVVKIEDITLSGNVRAGPRGLALAVRRLEGRTPAPGQGRRWLRAHLSGSATYDRQRIGARFAARLTGLGPVGPLRLTGRATGSVERINITGALRAPGGALASVSGWLDPGKETPLSARRSFAFGRYSLSTTVAQLDPSRVLRGAPRARLNLTLRVFGSGVPAVTGAKTNFAVALHPSRIAGLAINAGSLSGQLSDKKWKLHRASLAAGRSTVRLTGSGTTDGKSYRLQLRGTVPRLARFGRLQGRLELAGEVSRRSALSPTLRLDVTGRRLSVAGRDQVIQRATASVNGTPEQLTLEGSVRGAELGGRFRASASTVYDEQGPRRVDLFIQRLSARLAGRRIFVRKPARLRYERDKRIELSRLVVALLGGTATVGGSYDGREARVSARLDGIKLSDGSALSGKLGAVVSSATADTRVRLAAGDNSVEVDARVPIRFVKGSMVPSLATKRAGTLNVRGRLGFADLRRLAPGLPALPGRARLDLAARGSLDAPLGDLRLAVRGTKVGPVDGLDVDLHLQARSGSVALRVHGRRGDQETVRARLSMDTAPRVFISALKQRSKELLYDLPATASVRLAPTPLGAIHPVLRERLDGKLSGSLHVRGSLRRARTRLDLELAEARWGARAARRIAARGTFTTEAHRTDADIRVATLPLSLQLTGHAGVGLVSILEGRPLAGVPIRLSAWSPELDLARLGRLDPRLRSLKGRVKLTGSVSGPLLAPRARARLDARDVKVGAVPVGAVTTSAVYKDRKLRLEIDQPGTASPRRLHGELRVDLDGERSIAGRLRGAALASSLLPALPPAIWRAGGALGLDLGFAGTLARPEVSGTFSLTRGELGVLGVRSLRDLRFTVRARAEGIELSDLQARTAEGYVRGAGRLTSHSSGRNLVLDLHVARLGFDVGSVEKALFSGRVAVKGSLRDGLLKARVAVEQALVEMPGLESKRGLASARLPADVMFVDQRAGTPRSGRPLLLDLKLFADPVTLRDRRRRELDLTVAAALRARTDRRGRLRISGNIEGDRGKVTLFGNAFSVRHARVRFAGDERLNPTVDVRLARRVTDATLLVDVRGSLRGPEVKLGCDPPAYDQAQIMSLMVTGRVDARPPDSSSSDRSMAIASALLQATVGASAQRFLSRLLGFDLRFRVNLDERRDQIGGTTHVRALPELGVPITDWFYVGGRTVVGAGADDNTNEALLELRVPGSWAPTVTALFGDAAVGGLDLMWSFLF